jgi:hypothetical protein
MSLALSIAHDRLVALIFAQSHRKKMPSCATWCAFLHIEAKSSTDQFALMHAHFLSNAAVFWRERLNESCNSRD